MPANFSGPIRRTRTCTLTVIDTVTATLLLSPRSDDHHGAENLSTVRTERGQHTERVLVT